MPIIAIDFEASCLPRHGRSYPIEVGVSGLCGTRSWIIAPHPMWNGWEWRAEAEALHGLSREQIMREGLPAARIWAELVDMVGGARLVADSLIDQYWLDTLAQAAGALHSLTIDHISAVMEEWQVDETRIAAAVAAANLAHPARHRAAADALWLSALIDALSPAIHHAPSLSALAW